MGHFPKDRNSLVSSTASFRKVFALIVTHVCFQQLLSTTQKGSKKDWSSLDKLGHVYQHHTLLCRTAPLWRDQSEVEAKWSIIPAVLIQGATAKGKRGWNGGGEGGVEQRLPRKHSPEKGSQHNPPQPWAQGSFYYTLGYGSTGKNALPVHCHYGSAATTMHSSSLRCTSPKEHNPPLCLGLWEARRENIEEPWTTVSLSQV